MGVDAALSGMAKRPTTTASWLVMVLACDGRRDFGQRAGSAGSGIAERGSALPVASAISLACHNSVLARVCHHSCFMFAMGAFGIGGNGWRLSVNSDIR